MVNYLEDMDPNKPLKRGVSVIIPSYMATIQTIESVESIYRQGLHPDQFEVIVVNDYYPRGDDDARIEHEAVFHVLADMQACGRFPNLRIVDSARNREFAEGAAPVPEDSYQVKPGVNKGQSAARNTGMRYARFDRAYCHDDDDLLVFDEAFNARKGSFLERAMGRLEEDERLAFVSCSVMTFGEGSNRYILSPGSYPMQWFFSEREREIIEVLHAANNNVFHLRDAIAAGGYDEGLSTMEDKHFFGKLRAMRIKCGMKARVEMLPGAYLLYRRHLATIERVSGRVMTKDELRGYYRKFIYDALPLFQDVFKAKDMESVLKSMALWWREIEDKAARINALYKRLDSGTTIVGDSLSAGFQNAIFGARMLWRHADSREAALFGLKTRLGILPGKSVPLSTPLQPDVDAMGVRSPQWDEFYS